MQEEEEFVNQYLTRMERRLSEPDVSCVSNEEIFSNTNNFASKTKINSNLTGKKKKNKL